MKCHNTRKAPKIGAFNVFEKSLLYPEQEHETTVKHIDTLLFIKIADTTADTFFIRSNVIYHFWVIIFPFYTKNKNVFIYYIFYLNR